MERQPTFTHADIDRRLLRLVTACVAKIDADPSLVSRAREQVARQTNKYIRDEWEGLLSIPWADLRAKLLEESERGAQLRQNVPFGGFLSTEERMAIIRMQ